MNRLDLALALNAATDEDLLFTAQRINYVNHSKKRRLLRAFAAAAAAAVLLLATLGVAMATNDAVRQAVFSLFHISVPERVPQPSAVSPESGKITLTGHRSIGDAVAVDDYLIKSPMRPMKGGVSLWDAGSMRFYSLAPQGVISVPAEHHAFALPFHGVSFQINYDYAVTDHDVLLNWTEDPRVNENPYEYGWNLVQPGADSMQVFLELPDKSRNYQMVPLLLDLETEKLTDPFSGMPLDLIPPEEMNVWSYSEDGRYALQRDFSHHAWLYDLEAKTVTDLSDQITAAITETRFTPQNRLVLTMLDGDTYRFLQYDLSDQSSTCFVYSASQERADGTRTPGLLPSPAYWWRAPYRHSIMVTESGGCALLEIESGLTTELPDALLDDLPNVLENEAGTRLLGTKTELAQQSDGYQHRCISAIAVCDLRSKTLVELDREEYETAGEIDCFWLDDNRFAIWAESGSDDYTTLHVYTVHLPA